MKFEVFEDESYCMWGVRKVGQESGVYFARRADAVHALTLIESWVNEAAANVATQANEMTRSYCSGNLAKHLLAQPELWSGEHTVNANAIRMLKNYNLAKNDQTADYEKGIRE